MIAGHASVFLEGTRDGLRMAVDKRPLKHLGMLVGLKGSSNTGRITIGQLRKLVDILPRKAWYLEKFGRELASLLDGRGLM